MDYKDTLTLPKTDFPMRGGLPKKEPQIQKFWEEIDLYGKHLEKRAPREKFIMHDGPPYSDGDVHLGTALNKILKDIVVKYKGMRGYFSPFIPGWDNHGMPIENEVCKGLGEKRKDLGTLEIRQLCREYAQRFVGIQREQFKRLAVLADWGNPYLTMSKEFEAKVLRVFGELVEGGYIYRGLKPIHWCPTCETALAEAELEYKEKESISVWVRFSLQADPKGVFADLPKERCYALIWTTTPWTIPGNLAVAVHPEFEYVLTQAGDDYYLVAKALAETTMEELGISEWEVKRELKGIELEGTEFRHPIYDRTSLCILSDYVTLDQGTGCVHTAPGHGKEDFEVGKRYDLPPFSPVDGRGRFTEEAEEFSGLPLDQGNLAVLKSLRDRGALLKEGRLLHQYPYCWRCHNPLIFRATTQWFMNVDHDNHRRRALDAIDKVEWFPSGSINRIRSAVETRPDWCLSRQRAWGVGIPAFYCEACEEAILSKELISRIADIVEEHGSDAWFEHPASSFLPDGFSCPKCGGHSFRKESDILDVWFESGSTNRVVLEGVKELSFPADLYLEGSDQHRGWFNSSLMVSIATRGEAPYRRVITSGWTLDSEGRAMHKSLGNVIAPGEIVEKSGADVLRLWVASSDYFRDVRLSDEILERVEESYRKIRNTFRFLLGNLSDFDPKENQVPYRKLEELDRWALSQLAGLEKKVLEAYDSFEFHKVYHYIYTFSIITLSSFYLDVLKDRLYTFGRNSKDRRSAQWVLHQLALSLARLTAPLISHTAEEVWQRIPGEKERSVLLSQIPEVNESWIDRELNTRWDSILSLRAQVLAALELARRRRLIGNSLEARVILYAPSEELGKLIETYLEQLPTIFIVSQVERVSSESDLSSDAHKSEEPEVTIDIKRAKGEKCERCWIYSETIGDSKEHPKLCEKCVRVVEG